ncbi:hypothetical protein C8R47DRAFT_432479 [Mycena vitilis]|nr:hypothetical protein C8R47DRAFT_432479 [Mycena vitilis]
MRGRSPDWDEGPQDRHSHSGRPLPAASSPSRRLRNRIPGERRSSSRQTERGNWEQKKFSEPRASYLTLHASGHGTEHCAILLQCPPLHLSVRTDSALSAAAPSASASSASSSGPCLFAVQGTRRRMRGCVRDSSRYERRGLGEPMSAMRVEVRRCRLGGRRRQRRLFRACFPSRARCRGETMVPTTCAFWQNCVIHTLPRARSLAPPGTVDPSCANAAGDSIQGTVAAWVSLPVSDYQRRIFDRASGYSTQKGWIQLCVCVSQSTPSKCAGKRGLRGE